MNDALLITKCYACGWPEVRFMPGEAYARCPGCDRINDRPKSGPEATNRMKYANERRNLGEFDEAERAYREVLKACPEEHEARWGLLLCKYGVVYVEGTDDRKRLITCRRARNGFFCAEPDFQLVLEQASGEVREAYRTDGKYIDDVQRGIRSLEPKTERYDVFLCYKETAFGGRKTEDSRTARTIYDQLVQKGYRVFFAPESLKDKAGANYEAVIYWAVERSRAMLVIGTQKGYFSSPYVRSEWRRFKERMETEGGEEKLLIPLFLQKDDLPYEISPYQGYNMDQPYMNGIYSLLGKPAQRGTVEAEKPKASPEVKPDRREGANGKTATSGNAGAPTARQKAETKPAPEVKNAPPLSKERKLEKELSESKWREAAEQRKADVRKAKRRYLLLCIASVLCLTLILVAIFAENVPILPILSSAAVYAVIAIFFMRRISSSTIKEFSEARGKMVHRKMITAVKHDPWRKKIVIPRKIGGFAVTSIGIAAFHDLSRLTSVTIPDTVTQMGERAFAGCKRLSSVNIPSGVTELSSGVFTECGSLTNITIPKDVKTIGAFAFGGCGSLTSVNIPDGAASIGTYAFCGCKSLSSVTVPPSVASIGWGAFEGCYNLTVYGKANSAAEAYAKENGIRFVAR